jgi:hypothetical protein
MPIDSLKDWVCMTVEESNKLLKMKRVFCFEWERRNISMFSTTLRSKYILHRWNSNRSGCTALVIQGNNEFWSNMRFSVVLGVFWLKKLSSSAFFEAPPITLLVLPLLVAAG